MPYIAATLFGVLLAASRASAADPSPSWNDGSTKTSITEFIAKVTKEGSPQVDRRRHEARLEHHFPGRAGQPSGY
jgi:hypothetical protein